VTRDDAAARLTARLQRRLWLARSALAWETLWPLLWPVVGVAGLFAALVLFDALPFLPGVLHAAILALFTVAVIALSWRCIRGFHWPDEAQARRRIERDSGLEHRPLAVLGDKIAGNPKDPVARALWQLHRRRVLAAVTSLRVALPSPGLAAHDPLGLRAAVLLLVVIAGAVGYQDAAARLARSLIPAFGGGAATDAVAVQAWLTPPPYTGLAPVFLQHPTAPADDPQRTISVPSGTAVMALVQGGTSAARLRLGSRTADFAPLGDGSQKVDEVLAAGDGLAIALNARTLASWPVQVVADLAPNIRFSVPPEAEEGGRLRLKLEASDDYGVTKAWVEIRPLSEPKATPLVIEMPVPPLRARAAAGPQVIASRQDLTDHPWAGQQVTLTPVAEDGAGQRGAGEAVIATLPERVFTHPVAKAIIELRRKLGPGRAEIAQAIAGLDRLSAAPDAFGNDTVVFLELRDARARLYHGRDPDRITALRDQLWQTALRVEDGNKSVAERNLADAAKALEDALRNGAPPEDLEALVNQLQQAMQQYLQALLDDAKRKGLDTMPMMDSAQTVTPDELAGMLDQMREMAQLGSRDAAQQLLSQLRNVMDSLRAGMQGGGMTPQMRQAQQGLKDLSKLTQEQRQLLDQSVGQSRQPGKGDAAANQQGAVRQEDLRRRLGEAMRGLGEALGDIPPELGTAEQAMRDASGKLGRNDSGGAAESQGQALQNLQQGAQAAMEALSQQMQQGGMGMAGMQNGGGMRRDPFGRRMQGPVSDDGSVHIPDDAELHKAHDVMEELRRRASQPDRPRTERDYLQRLLRTF
jgi:uncharacterized protein (TIGR02302 family)